MVTISAVEDPPDVIPVHVGFDALYYAHYQSVVRLAALLGADEPEDVAQEAFFRLHQNMSSLREPTAALGYLRRTAVNLTRSRQRHLGVVRRLTPAGWLPHAPAADEVAAGNQEHRTLLRAVAALPPRQKSVLVLRYWLDLSLDETAATLKLPVGTVKSATSRAIARLAKQMEATNDL